MKFITHHRFKEIAACGEKLNIPYGTKLETCGEFIVTQDGKPICFQTSENAKIHFARNDDGRGLERGKLTYAIAYGKRKTTGGFRFTEQERQILEKNWSHWLRQDVDTILFNDDFFHADPEDLRKLAKQLKINM